MDRIFAETLTVFAFDSQGELACLQSRLHEPWAWLLSSSMRGDLRYSVAKCFDTFPFPASETLSETTPLNTAGRDLEDTRSSYTRSHQVGLTETYNRLKAPTNQDPEIIHLRYLHEAVDRAVLDAYGWSDIEVPPYCPTTAAEEKAVEAFEDEVLDRLFALNAERADEERKAGLTPGKKKTTKKKPAKKKTSKAQAELLPDPEAS